MTLAYLAKSIFLRKWKFVHIDVSNPLRSSKKSCEKMGHKMGHLLIKNLKTFKIYAVKISEYMSGVYNLIQLCLQAVLKPYNYYWQHSLQINISVHLQSAILP